VTGIAADVVGTGSHGSTRRTLEGTTLTGKYKRRTGEVVFVKQ